MSFPVFASGDVLNASDMNAVGLWLVKIQTVGSGVSSVTVTGAFSADYDNYLITLAGGSASALGDIRLQLGSSTASYKNQLIYGTYASTPLAYGATLSNFGYVGGSDVGEANAEIVLNSPFLTKYTKCFARYTNSNAGVSFFGQHEVASSYTAFTLICGAGTLTGGTIRVYGYRN